MYSSIISLVVPAISVTIALFCLNNAFNKDDFPTLGLPTIAKLNPSLINFPSSALLRSEFISFIDFSKLSATFNGILGSISSSSSVKSTANSTNANMLSIYSLNLLISLDKYPLLCINADFIAKSVLAVIISITASAWDKSILPFKKALFVNSPGSASLAPAFITVSKTLLVETTPPWQLISIVSSAVKLLGPFIKLIITSSISSLVSTS